MLGLILNETEIVNNILEGKEKLPSNSGKIIRIIIKNMILKNKNNEEIENIIINILEHTYGNNFNRAYWKKIIASMIKDLKSKNIKMIDIDNIKIYKEELEIIKSLEDLKTEKIAFILLVYAKINNIVNKFCSICLCLYKWLNHACLSLFLYIFATSLNNDKNMYYFLILIKYK